jgi:hypothetical protein
MSLASSPHGIQPTHIEPGGPSDERLTVPLTQIGTPPGFERRCRDCALHARSTTAEEGRKLELTPDDKDFVALRASWHRGQFSEEYRRFRPLVKRSIAWLVADRHRRVRFRGAERSQLWTVTTHRRHKSPTDGQPRVGPRRQLDHPHQRAKSAQARVSKRGTSPPGTAQPGWPASTLFTLGVRFGNTQARRTDHMPRTTIVQQSLSTRGQTPGTTGSPRRRARLRAGRPAHPGSWR